MALAKISKGTYVTGVIDDGTTLATTVRAADDYDNSGDAKSHPLCNAFLKLTFDSVAGTEGDVVAELWCLHGDGESSEKFPQGGDAGLGTNKDPTGMHYVGAFVTVDPSTTVEETLEVKDVPLGPAGNRFVIKNVHAQTWKNTWQLDILPFTIESQ